jgi:ABC-type sugar transport system ATPase subunit
VLGRAMFSEASILLIDEPTRGVDVGAKVDIWDELRRLASEGRAVCVVSSELEDFVGNVDRVLIVRERKIVDELRGEQIIEEALLRAVEGDSWAAPTTQGGNT